MPGVTNAFFVVLLVMCIYAILAVEFFRLVRLLVADLFSLRTLLTRVLIADCRSV